MSDWPEPSQWFNDRFGEHSLEVMLGLANAGRAAHERSQDAKGGSRLETDEAYGSFWVILPQEVANHLSFLSGREVIRPSKSRYDLVVFEGTLVFPAKCGRGSSGPERIKLAPSAFRNRVLNLDGAAQSKPPDQLDLGYELEENLETAIKDGTFGSAERVALVVYDASARSGLQSVWAGEATLDASGRVNWHYVEELPLHLLDGPGVALAALSESGLARFDDAPLPENVLSLRRRGEPAGDESTEDSGEQRPDGRVDDRT